MLRKSFVACVAAALVTVALPACAEVDGSLARVVSSKVLRVGVAMNTPWVFKKPDGSWAGYEIDLTTALAHDLGATPQYVQVPFGALIPGLQRGDFDLIASGLAMTAKRARIVEFTQPTGVSVIRAAVARSAGANPETAVRALGIKIAVMAGTAAEAAARDTFPKAVLVPFPNERDAVAALLGGQTAALVATSPVPRMTTRLADAEVRLIEKPIARTAEAFALRDADERLRAYVNNWIAARLTDGTIENTRQYWFFGFKWLSDLEPKRQPAK